MLKINAIEESDDDMEMPKLEYAKHLSKDPGESDSSDDGPPQLDWGILKYFLYFVGLKKAQSSDQSDIRRSINSKLLTTKATGNRRKTQDVSKDYGKLGGLQLRK